MILACLVTILQVPTEAGLFYQSGKIYVVVGVILLIFIGIILYLIRMEQKIKRLEKEQNL